VTFEYLDLADYLAIAEEVTGLRVETLLMVTNVGLADSALHAPQTGFGDEDLYESFVAKAAILLVRLAKNHPLPDGNKRAAWVSLRLFVEINGWRWEPYPAVDEAEQRRQRSLGDATHLADSSGPRNFSVSQPLFDELTERT
jgi:death-on-curing protein